MKRIDSTEFGNKRLLNLAEGRGYVGLGSTTFRKWADEIGATMKFGSRVLFDRKVIDAAIDRQKIGA